jgi:hypothetical protein
MSAASGEGWPAWASRRSIADQPVAAGALSKSMSWLRPSASAADASRPEGTSDAGQHARR